MSMARIVTKPGVAHLSRLRRSLLFVLLGAQLLLSGCYVMQAATGQADVANRSRPIAAVVADPATPTATRERLELAVQAREFAIRELALPDGKSFRRYADLHRPYAVWNVVATPEFSIEPRHWCFPVAGCVAYRGYFDESRARSMALKLARRGDDVTVGGVATYSTLGHFADPLFNTMIVWRESRFVGTIFHELAHERLYVAGDSEFNEAFASVVEEEGVRLWFESQDRAADLATYRVAGAREADFAALLRDARGRLARLYGSGLEPQAMRKEKQREFGRLTFAYEQLKRAWGGYSGYDAWFARVLNNADLAAVATYRDCMPGLQRELQAAGSLPAFYARAQALGHQRDRYCGTTARIGVRTMPRSASPSRSPTESTVAER
jgi:predicted aminopeptidase